MCGGAGGGLLGPADAVYQVLGEVFADQGIGTVRVGYRQANHLPMCLHDVVAAADLTSRFGGERFVTVGHSFGGAVAIQAGVVLGEHCRGVVTLSTQSAGCEPAQNLGDTPLLLLHGERDELLPPETSAVVQMIAGHGEIVVLKGAGHLLDEAVDDVRSWLAQWIPERFEDVPTFD
jgi:pimeloyl-ACP methyl ester carboxylesterase